MGTGVHIWWYLISSISILNIIALLYSAKIFTNRKQSINPDIYPGRKALLWLSGIYTFGCAFRSFLPRIDLERICLVDSWFSTMFVGRTVATLAELSFIIQCVLLLREAGKGVGTRFSLNISIILIVLIVTAECLSWYAVISTNYLGSVIEETLWSIAGLLLIGCFISLRPHVSGVHRYFLNAMIIICAGYLIFMLMVDVPMYWNRWQQDINLGTQYLSFNEGLLDAQKIYSVNFRWDVWQEEIPWMTLYFTIAVWVSIYLTHAPDFKQYSSRVNY
jgi:hypothetical protein